MDLPVWQELVEEIGEHGFTVIAVALDSEPGAADPWIEQAAPAYPALIDRAHLLSSLYGIVNVPTAVWIDEEGRIVRPAEVAGAYEAFRHVDPETRTIPDEHRDRARHYRQTYLDAIRDWVARGPESPHALAPDEVRRRLAPPDPALAEAHARFRLGQQLRATGNEAEARTQLDEASRLHPDSWAIWRQAADKLENGIAAGPAFAARVTALGERRYYPPPDIEGIED
jgi:hypothetical protein